MKQRERSGLLVSSFHKWHLISLLWNLFIEIIVEFCEVVKKVYKESLCALCPDSSSGNIFQNYSKISPSGYWHWHNPYILFRCLQLRLYFGAFVVVVQSPSHVWGLFATPWLQHSRLPSPLPSPRVCPFPYPLNQWCYPTISSSVALFSSAFNLSQHQGLFQSVSCSHQVAKLVELHLGHLFFPQLFVKPPQTTTLPSCISFSLG